MMYIRFIRLNIFLVFAVFLSVRSLDSIMLLAMLFYL